MCAAFALVIEAIAFGYCWAVAWLMASQNRKPGSSVVGFLASEQAGYISGQVISVNGAMV